MCVVSECVFVIRLERERERESEVKKHTHVSSFYLFFGFFVPLATRARFRNPRRRSLFILNHQHFTWKNYTLRTMSDHEVETFESTDAGASLTVPMQAGSVRKGGYIVIKGKACKVRLNALVFPLSLSLVRGGI